MARYDVVMLVLNDVLHDGRVQREAAALAADGWRVLVVGTQRANGPLPDREIRDGYELWRVRYGRYGSGLRRPWRWFRHGLQTAQIWRMLWPIETRAYHAHDLPALIVLSLVRRRRMVYDAHELYPFLPPYPSKWITRWQALIRPSLIALDRRLARRSDAVLGLCEARTRALALWYRIPRPTVIHNVVDPVTSDETAPLDLRARVGADRFIIVHTGKIADRGRCLSELIEAMTLLPEKAVLVLLGQGEEWSRLQEHVAKLGVQDRVIHLPPVAPDQVAVTIQTADVAACVLRPHAYNTRASIPNKLWEAVAAGLPLVAGNTFGVRRVVEQYRLGILCEGTNPHSIADAIRQMMDAGTRACYRDHVAAAQRTLVWDHEAQKLREVYRRLLGDPAHSSTGKK